MAAGGYWYSKTTCPACNAGLLAFAIGSDDRTQFVWCDECDSYFLVPNPTNWDQAEYPPSPNVPPWSRWATREEVEGYGWGEFLAGHYAGRV
jgi:hypothetical protein